MNRINWPTIMSIIGAILIFVSTTGFVGHIDSSSSRTLPPQTRVTYTIIVETGNISKAGTDANVYITIYGTKGTSPEMVLDVEGRNDFEKGDTNIFSLTLNDLGDLKKIQIRHDEYGSNSGWFLEKVVIKNEISSQEWIFLCHKWLARDEGDGNISRILSTKTKTQSYVTYTVTVETGNISKAGTDANVYIKLYGTKGTSPEMVLDVEGRNDFEKGDTNIFSLTLNDLGDLKKIQIRHDENGSHSGWFLDRIYIQNETSGREWIFECYKWLARDEGDGRISRELYPKT